MYNLWKYKRLYLRCFSHQNKKMLAQKKELQRRVYEMFLLERKVLLSSNIAEIRILLAIKKELQMLVRIPS